MSPRSNSSPARRNAERFPKLSTRRSRQPVAPPDEPKSMHEVLEKLVRSEVPVDAGIKFGPMRVLSEICLPHGLAPETCTLLDTAGFKIDRVSFKSSDCSSPREGRTCNEFCVKLLGLYSRSQRKLAATRQRFYHESSKWKQISHRNLGRVYEVSDVSFPGRITLGVMTSWAPNGNIIEYLKKHPRADRHELLAQAACGLEHLHTLGIVHGSINPGNILINESGQAFLVDFGINRIISHHTMSAQERIMLFRSGTRRYMPPELFRTEYDCCGHSEACDIYSLATTAFEILTGIVPYGECEENTIPWRIAAGERPTRPTDRAKLRWLPDPLWEMLEDCWNEDPELRWEARCVRRRFLNTTTARVQEMPCLGGALRPAGFLVENSQLREDDCPKYLTKCLEYGLTRGRRSLDSASNSGEQMGGDGISLDVFEKVLGCRPFDPLISRRFRKLCDRWDLVPKTYNIPNGLISLEGAFPIASGGFGDVWKGTYGEQQVAIKALRIYKNEDKRKASRVFYKEITIWKRLAHPNIVPFIGVTDGPAPLSMVLEWMPNGDVRHYVKDNPQVDRLQLLLDICSGLQALHEHDVVHGDLKSPNILINGLGWACLTDFGLSSISSLGCTESSVHNPGFGTYRWTAPELMQTSDDQPERPSKKSDVYSFAMVAIEVFTGHVPFAATRADPAIMFKVTSGERPPRPVEATGLGLTDDLWGLIESAWAHEAERRPPAEKIIAFLIRAD